MKLNKAWCTIQMFAAGGWQHRGGDIAEGSSEEGDRARDNGDATDGRVTVLSIREAGKEAGKRLCLVAMAMPLFFSLYSFVFHVLVVLDQDLTDSARIGQKCSLVF